MLFTLISKLLSTCSFTNISKLLWLYPGINLSSYGRFLITVVQLLFISSSFYTKSFPFSLNFSHSFPKCSKSLSSMYWLWSREKALSYARSWSSRSFFILRKIDSFLSMSASKAWGDFCYWAGLDWAEGMYWFIFIFEVFHFHSIKILIIY